MARWVSSTLEADTAAHATLMAVVRPLEQAMAALDLRLSTTTTSLISKMDDLDRRCSVQGDELAAMMARLASLDTSLSEHKAIVDSEFVAMDSRITAIPSHSSDVPLGKSG